MEVAFDELAEEMEGGVRGVALRTFSSPARFLLTGRRFGPHIESCETLLFNSIKVNEPHMNRPAQLELVGRKIRQLRRQRKLTQVELAEKIGKIGRAHV